MEKNKDVFLYWLTVTLKWFTVFYCIALQEGTRVSCDIDASLVDPLLIGEPCTGVEVTISWDEGDIQ